MCSPPEHLSDQMSSSEGWDAAALSVGHSMELWQGCGLSLLLRAFLTTCGGLWGSSEASG